MDLKRTVRASKWIRVCLISFGIEREIESGSFEGLPPSSAVSGRERDFFYKEIFLLAKVILNSKIGVFLD